MTEKLAYPSELRVVRDFTSFNVFVMLGNQVLKSDHLIHHKIRLISVQLSKEHLWLYPICHEGVSTKWRACTWYLRDAWGAVIFFPNDTYNKGKGCDSFKYMMHLTLLYAIASVKSTEIILWRVESFLCLCYLCTSEYLFIGNIWI